MSPYGGFLRFGAAFEERRAPGKIAQGKQYLLDQAQDEDLEWFRST